MMTCSIYLGQVIVINGICLVMPNAIGVRGRISLDR